MKLLHHNHQGAPMPRAAAPTGRRRMRVMIVEDSLTVREFLVRVISEDPRLEVAAAVESGEEALRVIDSVAPDVISMDIRLPGMDGFEATRRIMKERPTPIVVIAGSVEDSDLSISMNALSAGALSVLEKPRGLLHEGAAGIGERICTQLAIMSQVKVVRQRPQLAGRTPPEAPADKPADRPPSRIADRSRRAVRAVGIVSSTGGPSALLALLGALPESFPAPILLVQHMGASFMSGFIQWLDAHVPLTVVEAEHGMEPEPGHVYAAPAEHHLLMAADGTIKLDRGAPVCHQRPSGTLLLRSMAEALDAGAMGIILTGMGDDGAEGLAAIRRGGGYTITEDESTAVVYGMPAVAVEIGASMERLPLPAIAPRMRAITQLAEVRS